MSGPAPSPEHPAARARYADLLREAVFATDPLATEAALAAAADLGRDLVRQEIPPEEVTEIHHEALMALASAAPELPLGQVAGQLTAPLMEAYMAYSLAFREQLERRAEAMVNARLEQSRRLEAIGTLAAGIAHDFNNLIGAILGFSELIADDLPTDAPSQRHLRRIQQASARARDLVARLLIFARDFSDDPIAVDWVPQIRETLELLRASLAPHIRILWQCEPAAAWVLAEPSQLQQILMNLCINAADAIGSRHGRIEVELSGSQPPPDHPALASVPVWALSVRDDGEGMSRELQQRVFDPFFTTKEPGKGSGLGLSVIHGIVGKLGGTIAIESAPGSGSRFVVWLPRLTGGAGIPATV